MQKLKNMNQNMIKILNPKTEISGYDNKLKSNYLFPFYYFDKKTNKILITF